MTCGSEAGDARAGQYDETMVADGHRFIQTPTTEVMDRIEREGSELKNDVENLGKKLHYYEQTEKNSRDGFEKLLRSAGGA